MCKLVMKIGTDGIKEFISKLSMTSVITFLTLTFIELNF